MKRKGKALTKYIVRKSVICMNVETSYLLYVIQFNQILSLRQSSSSSLLQFPSCINFSTAKSDSRETRNHGVWNSHVRWNARCSRKNHSFGNIAMNRLGYIVVTFLLLQVAVFGKTFAECSTEEEAIGWLRQSIADNQKMDKNIISIVFIMLIFSFSRLCSVLGGWWQNTL